METGNRFTICRIFFQTFFCTYDKDPILSFGISNRGRLLCRYFYGSRPTKTNTKATETKNVRWKDFPRCLGRFSLKK